MKNDLNDFWKGFAALAEMIKRAQEKQNEIGDWLFDGYKLLVWIVEGRKL